MKTKFGKRLYASLLAISLVLLGFVASAAPANAVGSYNNASIADIALTKVGQYGGQCKTFANNIVKQASGNTQWPAPGYHSGFANAGGIEVSSQNAAKGDIIQIGNSDYDYPLHTAIIVTNKGGGNFNVVDSNWGLNEIVMQHDLNPYTWAPNSNIKIWRMGAVASTPPPTSDWDGDGTPDSTDLLPDVAGPVNNRGVPIESSRLSGDFNGDKIQDIAVFFNYSGGQTKLWLFPGTGSGNFGTPQMKWDSGPGSWWVQDIKPVAGDFNGDSLTDVGLFYNFGTRTQLWTFTATPSGMSAPVMKWDSGAGNWNWSATQQVVGDFNADGLQDIAAFFDYGGGRTKLWWFASTGSGFSSPTVKWDSGAGNWWWQQSKPVVGDFNADGLQDIAAFYNYGGGSTKLWLFPGAGSGNFGTPQMKWDSGPGNWWWSQLVPLAGDFNGDHIQDITVFYDHGNGLLRTWRFLGNGSGFNAPTVTWDSGAGNWWLKDVKPVVGDFDGDGLCDIATFYNFGTRTSLWLFKSTGTALGSPTVKWDSGAGNWTWKETLLL